MSETQKATFAAGCFWGVEEIFRATPGVLETQVGYTGGKRENPSYEQVCSTATGHAEAVEIVFDPAKVSYEDLLRIFWENHDPTTRDRQGPDVGSQYRSAIFFHTSEQEEHANIMKAAFTAEGKFGGRQIVTEIVPAMPFYRAEEYHQRYNERHGLSCRL